ncbi:low molecular weight phosphotyrosine protein phosphatase [Oxalobacter aliiformigenes]|uniref:protein-tyrosine-phosphatase n=1 Tax=Oxalobacter aliiformigenes TaxID=2946593 RepID=A0ABY7JPD4_9BURK|nr:low molecular weight protein-tyrosine-phosphatase [Oxalobacter aliiformigenes]WAV92535.1 low molecular weight phosphotyrosine protein phosphatase [Oxalobacter aliiformigenes]WAV95956.1 low molecular weight phosphotyrosine protein phosphatase [Oxalobacter aliiformigenes]WAV98127.1 low molecular weight phosphotyrosine protein phosphatase [Oxalobacter aliiformigenes]
MINSILVICLGNICRSPMAEGLLKKRYPDKDIASAGLEDITAGWFADPSAIHVMKENGIDISRHRARVLTKALLEKADLVLAMEKRQSDSIRSRFPNYRGKIMRVGEFGNYDVPDPYSKDINAFHESFDLISKGLDEIGQHVIHPENREQNAS